MIFVTELEAFKELALNPDEASVETIKVALHFIDKTLHPSRVATFQEQTKCHDTGSPSDQRKTLARTQYETGCSY